HPALPLGPPHHSRASGELSEETRGHRRLAWSPAWYRGPLVAPASGLTDGSVLISITRGEGIAQQEVVAATLETDERSPHRVIRGELFAGHQPGTHQRSIPTCHLRRQRQKQLIQQPFGEEEASHFGASFDEHELTRPDAGNCI